MARLVTRYRIAVLTRVGFLKAAAVGIAGLAGLRLPRIEDAAPAPRVLTEGDLFSAGPVRYGYQMEKWRLLAEDGTSADITEVTLNQGREFADYYVHNFDAINLPEPLREMILHGPVTIATKSYPAGASLVEAMRRHE